MDPHQPFTEQQLPKVEPWQVKPLVPPHVASVLTFLVGTADVAAEVRVTVVETIGVVVVEGRAVEVEAGRVEVDETGVPAPERYQLATGSPRHSPTVTAL